MRWLLENVGLILLALIVALVIWVAQEWERDPIVEGQFDEAIPVRVENLPPGAHLVDGWQSEVQVRLRAPQSVWDQLEPTDFDAVLDLTPNLSPLESGEWDVEAQVSFDVEPAVLLQVEPEFIRVELETIRELVVPVTAQVRGEADLGYRAGEPVVEPEAVNVRGPASLVDQVKLAQTTIFLQGASETVADQLTLVPVDAEGKRVSGVELDIDQVHVSVPVTPLPNVKEMSVTMMQSGQPAEGYHITNVAIDPPVVRVFGPVFILDDLPGFLTTVPISIEGRTEDVVERLPLELPLGVAMFDPSEPAVRVIIEIEPFYDSETVTRTLTFQGQPPGLTAIASPEVVEVILSGPRPRLSALLPEDVRVILDLSDMRLGDEAQLEPVVIAPEGITIESIIPSVVQVQIVPAPTPTPTPEPQE